VGDPKVDRDALATVPAAAPMASTILQLRSSRDYLGRIVALWVFVHLGTTPRAA
jgi:hypothetical protein